MKNLILGILLLSHFHSFTQTSTDREITPWVLRDPQKDSVFGTSLERAYQEILINTPKNGIIVAVIDSAFDLTHPDLQGMIYTNKGEIPQNGIDDDGNGYIDDVHGWNFTGYDIDKVAYQGVYEHILTIQQQEDWEAKKTGSTPVPQELLKQAKKLYIEKEKENKANYEKAQEKWNSYEWLRLNHGHVFPNDVSYDYYLIDSITNLNEEAKNHKNNLMYLTVGPDGIRDIKEDMLEAIEALTIHNNIKNRIWDKADSLRYVRDTPGRGTPYVQAMIHELTHGTQVATAIAATRGNFQGIRGFGNHIRIMPLVVLNGVTARDKDFFNAVKYAVDNGAKVINYSYAKTFSEDPGAYTEALEYARDHDVLFVCASSNESVDMDNSELAYYPNRHNHSPGKPLTNFIKVGAIAQGFGEDSYAYFSNYGKNEVDIFAPGMFLPVGYSREFYLPYTSGTSFASAYTSGAAALLRSIFPNLSAKETKRILMDSGRANDYEVKISEDKTVKFSDMSISGKVLNIYDAIIMAKKISKTLYTSPRSTQNNRI